MKKKWKNINIRSSKCIWTFSMTIFIIVVLALLFSTYYMNLCISQEEEAQTRRAEYKQLGQDLGDASDYLTDEVRYYAITMDITHLYNYWYEIHENRQRERAIETFESNRVPEEERELLATAKKYSDLLVETETYAMKLVLLSLDQSPEDFKENEKLSSYVAEVMSYELPESVSGMTAQEMQDAAVSLLYDDNYEDYKTKIMSPIEEFQQCMNARLDNEVEEKKQGTRMATVLQIILATLSLASIGFLLYIMNRLYITPLKEYTEDMKKTGYDFGGEGTSLLETKIIPRGAAELTGFAEAFNRLIELFIQELKNRKNAEEKMRQARNEAELANQAKSIFLAQMSHELRTPLNGIQGYTYLLEHTVLTKKQSGYAKNIYHSANGLLEIINQILDFSKIESGQMELENTDFSIADVAEEVHSVLYSQAEKKGLTLEVQLDEAIPHVLRGDALRLRQVLVNLIGNALKFTEQGSVTLTIKLVSMSEKACVLRFDVIDTGIGVSEEAREKIFQPFTQSDASITRRYGGTGLGLSICNQIISLASGGRKQLQLISEIGKGSDFYFEMTFEQGTDTLCTMQKAEDNLPFFNHKKVLLTDDNEVNIQVQSEILKLCGLTVITADSGKKALEQLAIHDDISLIFMDIRMPQMDGYETTREIRKLAAYKDTPIIALTADAVKDVQQKAWDAGMTDCLLKPVKQHILYRMLRQYLDMSQTIGADCIDTVSVKEDILDTASDNLFDMDRCLRQLGGKKSALKTILHTFLNLHKEDCETIRFLIEQKNYQAARDAVHTIKGISGNLCCIPLASSSAALQHQLERGYHEEFTAFTTLFKQTFSTLEEAYQSLPEEVNQTRQPEDGLEKIVKNLYTLCEDHDTEAITLLETYSEALSEQYGVEAIEKLLHAAGRFDFEQMCHILKKL